MPGSQGFVRLRFLCGALSEQVVSLTEEIVVCIYVVCVHVRVVYVVLCVCCVYACLVCMCLCVHLSTCVYTHKLPWHFYFSLFCIAFLSSFPVVDTPLLIFHILNSLLDKLK